MSKIPGGYVNILALLGGVMPIETILNPILGGSEIFIAIFCNIAIMDSKTFSYPG